MKSYRFEVKMECVGTGWVTANSLEEAKQKILNNDYEDIYDMCDHEIAEIIDIEEEQDE